MNDIATLDRVIAKCERERDMLNRNGCAAQARVAESLAASFRSMRSQARKEIEERNRPRCSCCGTTENLRRDYGSGGPYRCRSDACVVF